MAERQSTGNRARRQRLDASSFVVPRRPSASGPGELHICPGCDSDLVYPTDWTPVDEVHWRVDLRCPECEWSDRGTYAQDMLNRFDAALDSGMEQLFADLRLLTRANLEEQFERFIAALHTDRILPEDF